MSKYVTSWSINYVHKHMESPEVITIMVVTNDPILILKLAEDIDHYIGHSFNSDGYNAIYSIDIPYSRFANFLKILRDHIRGYIKS